MNRNKDIEQIEQYLNNQLDESQRIALESRLDQEEDFAAEFDRHESAHKVLDFVIAKNLKEQLMELEAESKVVPMGARRRRLMVVLSAAASVLLLVGVFYTNFIGGSMTSPELASAYYELPEPRIRNANTTVVYPEGLESGLAAMRQGNYSDAITELRSVPQEEDYYILAQFFLGHALYLTQDFSEAQKAFDLVSTINDVRYQHEAEWFGALSCLAQDGDCSERVEAIAGQSNHDFNEDAGKILKKMK